MSAHGKRWMQKEGEREEEQNHSVYERR